MPRTSDSSKILLVQGTSMRRRVIYPTRWTKGTWLISWWTLNKVGSKEVVVDRFLGAWYMDRHPLSILNTSHPYWLEYEYYELDRVRSRPNLSPTDWLDQFYIRSLPTATLHATHTHASAFAYASILPLLAIHKYENTRLLVHTKLGYDIPYETFNLSQFSGDQKPKHLCMRLWLQITHTDTDGRSGPLFHSSHFPIPYDTTLPLTPRNLNCNSVPHPILFSLDFWFLPNPLTPGHRVTRTKIDTDLIDSDIVPVHRYKE